MDHLKRLVEKQAKRYDLLRKLYFEVDGSPNKLIDFPSFAVEQGADRNEVDDTLDYLISEGLLESIADEGLVQLSHRGIVEIEHSITRPDAPTEHFTPQVIQHFHAPVGAVQNAANSTANINQNMGASVSEVFSLLQDLRLKFQELPPEKHEDALQLVDGIEAEVKGGNPSVARLKAMYSALSPFITDVGANVLAAVIAKQLGF